MRNVKLKASRRWGNTLLILAFFTVSWLAVTPAVPVNADTSTNYQLFESGKYAEYLKHIDEELGKTSEAWPTLSLSKVIAVAISIDKSNQWDGAVTVHTRELLTASPDDLRYFDATKRMLKGDIVALEVYFEKEPPKYEIWQRQIELLRRHGYSLAADVFAVVAMAGRRGFGASPDPSVVSRGVKAWGDIPADKSEALYQWVSKRLENDWLRRQEIAATAIGLSVSSDNSLTNSYLNTALRMGSENEVFTVANAQRFVASGKVAQGINIADKAARLHLSDIEIQLAVSQIFRQYADVSKAASFHRDILKLLVRPQSRELRLNYLNWLKLKGATEIAQDVIESSGAIGKADKLLINGELVEAARVYKTLVNAPKLSTAEYLEALSGLLAASPEEGIEEAQKVVKRPLSERELMWLGWELWERVRQEMDGIADSKRISNVAISDSASSPRISFVCATKAAAVMERIIELLPDTALISKLGARQRSLRVPLAVMFRLSRQMDKSNAILEKQVTYEVPAPPGGWLGPPGMPAPPDAMNPRTVTSPKASELQKNRKYVSELLERWDPTVSSWFPSTAVRE